MKRIYILLLLLSWTAISMLTPGVVNGQSRNNIDVALVMDSSGSMKKTDPNYLRIPAAKLFISLLGSQDRASVLSFSDQGYAIAGLTPVDNDANKDKLLNATDRISSKGLYTNLYSAFKKGKEVLLKSKKEGRDQIIILMSDGMMDVGDAAKDTQLLTKLKSELSLELKNNNVKVYAIAFTDQSDRKLLEKLSKQTGGFYNLAQTDRDFHVIFTSIFESLKSPEMLPMEKNTFLIDPSIEEVTIVVSKESSESDILIHAPDGQQYSGKKRYSGISWFASDNFDMITVQRPVEGRWEILYSTGENNKAYIITDLALETNFEQLYAVFGENLDIKAWLEKEGSVIKEGEVLETTEFSIELNNPDGNISKLKPLNKGDGIFNKTITPFKDGNYQLRVVAKGQTYERQKAFLFNVANLQESKEDLKAAREARLAGQEGPGVSEKQEEPVNWIKIIIQFAVINIFIGIMVVLYMKRHSIKDIKLVGKALRRFKGTASSPSKSSVPGKSDAATEKNAREAEKNKDVKTEKKQIILDEATSENDTEKEIKDEIKKPAAEKPVTEVVGAEDHNDEAASGESDLDTLEAEIQRLEKLKQQDEVAKATEDQPKAIQGENEQQSGATDTDEALSEQDTIGKESTDDVKVDVMRGKAAVESPEEKEVSTAEEQKTGAGVTKNIKEISEPDTEEKDINDTGAEESRTDNEDEEINIDDMWSDALNEQAAEENGERKENIDAVEQQADRPAPDENISATPELVKEEQQSGSNGTESGTDNEDEEINIDDMWSDALNEQAAEENGERKENIDAEEQQADRPAPDENISATPKPVKEEQQSSLTDMDEAVSKDDSGREDNVGDLWTDAMSEQAAVESAEEKAGSNVEMQKTGELARKDANETPETERETKGAINAEDSDNANQPGNKDTESVVEDESSTEMPEINEPDTEVNGEEDIADMWAAALDEQVNEDESIEKTDSSDNDQSQNSEEHTEDNSEKSAGQVWADVLSDNAEEESEDEKQPGIKNDPKGTPDAAG